MNRLSAAIALAATVALVAGCGSSGAGGPATKLSVTKDFGAETVASASVPATAGLTALRQLEQKQKTATKYGGRYISSIGPLAEDSDDSWLFYVDGKESTVGAAGVRLKAGQEVQWDFHPWQNVRTGGAIVGAYPRPLKQTGVRIDCRAPSAMKSICATAADDLRSAGVNEKPGGTRFVVGPWNSIKRLDGVPDLTADGSQNGGFAQFSKNGDRLTPVAADGSPAKPSGAGAGLLMATEQGGAPLVWIATGTDVDGVHLVLQLLGRQSTLRNRFAFIADASGDRALPLEDAP